jgi:sugar O-acyltransferase (sialic acid O-acetyltransferase NeuD family)
VADIVIFGNRDLAELAHFYLTHDSPHRVVAFCVHQAYLPPEGLFQGLPVVAYETLEAQYPPDSVSAFAPLTHQGMGKLRREVYHGLKDKGYTLINYISSKATTFPGLSLGDNCFILENNTVQPFVTLGSNVVLWSGNHIGHHSRLGDHVFFTSQAVLSGHCQVGDNCFVGVNASIRDGLTLAEGTLVGMGAVLTKNTEAWGVYTGNPARKGPRSSPEVM